MSTKKPNLIVVQTSRQAQREEALRAFFTNPVNKLPFVHTPFDASNRDFWRVVSTGDYSQDWNLGVVFGREMVTYLRRHGVEQYTSTLCSVIADMIRKGYPAESNDGIAMGFVSVISDAVAGRDTT